MDAGECLPSATEIHDVRSREVDVDPRAAGPAAPHVQPEGLGWIVLRLLNEGVGRRRRRRGGRRSLMKNSRGWSPTWPSITGGIAGGGTTIAPPRPPLPRPPRRPRPRPLPLPLVSGSAAASSWEGGTRCRVATLAPTVEGPAPPLAMTGGRKERTWKKMDAGRTWDDIPLPLLIKRRGRGSAAPLGQSSHRRRRESGPTRCPSQRRPGFPPPSPATCMEDAWRAGMIERTGEATVPHPVIVGHGRLEGHDPSPPE